MDGSLSSGSWEGEEWHADDADGRGLALIFDLR